MTIKEYVAYKKALIKNEISSQEIKPHLVIVQVNDDFASNTYINGKIKDCEELNIISTLIKLESNTSEKDLLKAIDILNKKDGVDGFIVQMPLPEHINENKIKEAINPKKDVDGFNLKSHFKACTPYGIIRFLEYLDYDFVGKNAVVIGRSNIVGKPAFKYLLEKNCNVTQLHSKTKKEDMAYYLKHADLVIVAIGKPNIIDEYTFKDSAYLFDVGINRDENNKLCGDIKKDQNVAFQSPVPGGVGLLTRLCLIENLMEAYRNGI